MQVRVGGLSDQGRSLGGGTFKLSPQGSVNYAAGGGGGTVCWKAWGGKEEGGFWVLNGALRGPGQMKSRQVRGMRLVQP